MCFVFIWEQTATCATYSINWLVFITEMNSVYSAVRTGSLNKTVCASSLNGQIMFQTLLHVSLLLLHLQEALILCLVKLWDIEINSGLLCDKMCAVGDLWLWPHVQLKCTVLVCVCVYVYVWCVCVYVCGVCVCVWCVCVWGVSVCVCVCEVWVCVWCVCVWCVCVRACA